MEAYVDGDVMSASCRVPIKLDKGVVSGSTSEAEVTLNGRLDNVSFGAVYFACVKFKCVFPL